MFSLRNQMPQLTRVAVIGTTLIILLVVVLGASSVMFLLIGRYVMFTLTILLFVIDLIFLAVWIHVFRRLLNENEDKNEDKLCES